MGRMERCEWNALRARYRRELRENPELQEFRDGWLKAVGVTG